MVFYICMALAVNVTLMGIVSSVKGLNLFGRLESPVHAVLAVSLINTCILYIPWFLYSWQPELGDFKNRMLIVPFMIIRLMQTVSMDADYEAAIDIANLAQVSGVSEHFLQFYCVVLSYVSVMVPLSGILTIVGIFGNGIGYRFATGRMSGRKRVYIFNGIGEKNLELAQSIFAHEGKNVRSSTFIFCNVRGNPEASVKARIRKLRGWFTADYPSVLLRTVKYRSRRKVSFFLLEGEERNFNDVLGILKAAEVLSGGQKHWSEADRVKIDMLLESDQLDNILDAQEKYGIFVRIINAEWMCAQELFRQWPVFSALSRDQKTISMLIIGNGKVAEKVLYDALWMGQAANTSLKIFYIGEDADELQTRMYMTSPALFDPALAGGIRYELKFEDLTDREQLRLHERELPDANYVVVACGDDETNVRTAMWVRTWIARHKPDDAAQPFMAVCIRDSRRAKRADRLCILESRESYGFHVFGTDSRLFSAENFIDSRIEWILYHVQMAYLLQDQKAVPTKEQKSEAWMQLNQSVYNFRSSNATAQYSVSRLFDAGALEESMRREFAGEGSGSDKGEGTARKYSGYEQAVYWAEAVRAAEKESDRTRLDLIISVYEEIISDPEIVELLARAEHRRWITYMAGDGWIPLPMEELGEFMRTHDGRHKDYLRLRHAAIAKWEDLDTISEIMTEGKNRDDLKNCDRMMVRESRRFLY